MEIISFKEWLNLSKESSEVLIDLDSVPGHMAKDYARRNHNLTNKRKLCDRCQGTGNELYSMYRKCTLCGGKGAKGQIAPGDLCQDSIIDPGAHRPA